MLLSTDVECYVVFLPINALTFTLKPVNLHIGTAMITLGRILAALS